jgi:NADPH:quinone reductase-like Zn-dependent oxidoreductase
VSATTYLAMEMAGPGLPTVLVERAVPDPGPGQAVVRVLASSMNVAEDSGTIDMR